MATWAIGDVQGCMGSLARLLERLELDPARDRIWSVGDLVNRGPRSLDVLRWARRLGDALTVVLGNHDLHLLQRVAGVAPAKDKDTLDEIFAAPDRDDLIDWLRHRPLVHAAEGRLLVHAGLHPRWSAADARRLAGEIEAGLRSDDWKAWIAQLADRDREPRGWDEALRGTPRLQTILSYLVRVRCLDDSGVPDPDFDEHPRCAPARLSPWFDARTPAWSDHTIVFGHWAALGLTIGVRHLGLDSGCVWGRQLTAVCLDDGMVVQVRSIEGVR